MRLAESPASQAFEISAGRRNVVKPPSAAASPRYHLITRLVSMALKIAADIEIWSCGWMIAAIATCQGLTPAASSALGFLFARRCQLAHAR